MKKVTICLMALVLAGFGVNPVYADSGDSGSSSKLAPFQDLIDDEKYQQAITKLDQAVRDAPGDADLLNLVAYSHRKLDHFDIALDHYLKALKIDPEHRGANEYLGELYLKLGQPEKAEERLGVLDKDCFFGCEEFDELEQAINDYQKQNPS